MIGDAIVPFEEEFLEVYKWSSKDFEPSKLLGGIKMKQEYSLEEVGEKLGISKKMVQNRVEAVESYLGDHIWREDKWKQVVDEIGLKILELANVLFERYGFQLEDLQYYGPLREGVEEIKAQAGDVVISEQGEVKNNLDQRKYYSIREIRSEIGRDSIGFLKDALQPLRELLYHRCYGKGWKRIQVDEDFKEVLTKLYRRYQETTCSRSEIFDGQKYKGVVEEVLAEDLDKIEKKAKEARLQDERRRLKHLKGKKEIIEHNIKTKKQQVNQLKRYVGEK